MSWKAKSSEAPGYVILRDRRSGRPVRIPVGVIPKIFWPGTWYENPYWRYSGALSGAEVAEFFSAEKREIRPDFAGKLATYILDYAQNLAAAVWLINPNKDGYLRDMKPCVEKLAAVKARARCRRDIDEMIQICLDYAVDPF